METHSLPPAPPNFPQPSVGKGSPLKSLPAPLRLIIRPILFAALGFHALLLFTPLPAEQKPKPPEDKKNPVKITQIQTVKPLKTVPTNAPKADVSTPTQLKVSRPTDSPTVSDTSRQQETKTEQSQPNQQGQTNQQPNDTKDPFQGFPYYQPSTPNCFNKNYGEQCRVATASLTDVKTFFDKSLPANQYAIEQPTEAAPDKQIYKIAKGGKTRYLHLFIDGSTVVILLDETKKTLKDLKDALPALPDQYTLSLGDVAGNAPEYSNFAQPQYFYDRTRTSNEENGIEDPNVSPPKALESYESPKIILGKTPDEAYQVLASKLAVFEGVNRVGDYGGGPLYEMKKDKNTFFLNLVPAKDVGSRGGTIMVTWLKDPRS